MKTIFICPRLDGHFRKYFEVLSEPARDDSLCVCASVLQLCKMLKPFGTSRVRVALLAGDFQISIAIWLCILGYGKRCTSIIYYTHFQSPTPRKILKMTLLRVMGWLGVKVLFLESGPITRKNWNSLPDLIDSGKTPPISKPDCYGETSDSDCLRFLVFGYMSARKCIVELIESIDRFSAEHLELHIEVRILGAWDPHYFQELSAILESPRNYLIEIRDEYVPEDELIGEIHNALCVMAVYRDHVGSSGVVNLAVANRKCVVFVPRGYLKVLARALGFENLPASVSALDTFDALEKLHEGGFEPNFSVDTARKYVEARSPEKFRTKFYESY